MLKHEYNDKLISPNFSLLQAQNRKVNLDDIKFKHR